MNTTSLNPPENTRAVEARCCIVGGGPAGMMAGFLLARAGVDVLVLEKHKDFLRDFRGDTIHPSTLQVLHELGLLEEFLQRPHQKASSLHGYFGDQAVLVADFSHLKTRCPFIVLMPQWDFLNFISEQARKFPSFRLEMEAEVQDLIEENGRVVGVRAQSPTGPLEARCDLVIGADGRHSTTRPRAHLAVREIGAPIDVLWMRLPRKISDPEQVFGRVNAGRMLIMLNREEYWQCAFVIRKNGFKEIQQKGLEHFRAEIARIAPFVADRVDALQSWDQIKLLTVAIDRLNCWHRAGLLCIGDAAHAMSPVGGVGINLAIQDAIATANVLAEPLRRGPVSEVQLAKVQKRREWPTRMTQSGQVMVQNRILGSVLDRKSDFIQVPWFFRLMQKFPALSRVPARLIGLGFRPEHVHSPAAD